MQLMDNVLSMDFLIIPISVTPLEQQCRVLIAGGSAVVVDPGGDIEKILPVLSTHKATLGQIWLTHCHIDHCAGVAELLRHFPSRPLYATLVERPFREVMQSYGRQYGMTKAENCPEPTTYLKGGEELCCGDRKFRVELTPGHSPGHVIFICDQERVVIAGDTLFAGTIGRTDLPLGNHAELIHSIQTKIMSLDDSYVVMPGHGPDTTVGTERNSNPFL